MLALARKRGAFVVQRLVPARPQDRLAQPLQPECQQERADDEAQRADRNVPQRRPERGHDPTKDDRRGADADQRRPPAANDADGQHDRERLDGLDGAREERRQEGDDVGSHGSC